jgi:outer membrane protein assembly factor BamB
MAAPVSLFTLKNDWPVSAEDKKTMNSIKPTRMAMAMFALLLFTIPCISFETPLWTFGDVKWYSLMESGNLMVGTKSNLMMLDGETGKALWSREDLGSIKEAEFTEMKGTPLILIADNSGWGRQKTKLTAIDTLTGTTVWETEKMKGYTVQVSPLYERDLLVFLTIKDNRRNKDKPDIYGLRFSTGELLWQSEYSEKVDLYSVVAKTNSGAKALFMGGGGGNSGKYDLSGENPPIFDGDSMYMTYAGLHRYDLNDGQLVWKTTYDVTDGTLKNTNGQAVIDGEVIYTSAKGVIRAIDKNTGTVKWMTKDFGNGGIAELQMHDKVLYGRMGGNFFSAKKEEWLERGPMGVVAINTENGSTDWIYKEADDSITNMLVLPSDNVLLIADRKNLIGLDLSSRGKVKEKFKIRLKFKRRLGGDDITGMAFGIGGSDRRDPPVSIVRQENGTVVVRGKQHLLAFDPATQQIPWSTKYEAPGISGWQQLVMTAIAITASSASSSATSALASRGYYNAAYQTNKNFSTLLTTYQSHILDRFSASKGEANMFYVLTKMKKDGKSGSGLVGVNLLTGFGERQIMFNDKSPDYEIDELAGRLFNLNKGTISCYAIEDKPENLDNTDDEEQ